MSDNHAPSADVGQGYEPDDVPVKMLVGLAAALTFVVIHMVGFTVFYFDHIVDQEMISKGYSERIEGAVPR
ncbi:MAG: hypothetical protein VX899_01175 [Myxococcota bacterium]|nr:hypothetical protein [Myxococcota bacterium]